MLKKLFGAKADSSPNPKAGPQIGMLALKSGKGLNASRIVEAWTTLFPSDSPITAEKPSKDSPGVVTFACDARSVLLAAMPAPIPQTEIDEAAERSWMWDEALSEMRQQKAHAIVTAVPAGEAVAEAVAVTKLLAAAASAADSAGIYWGSGGHVHKPEFFIDAAKSFGEDGLLPVMLWVGILISGKSERGPFTLTTEGLNAFGHKELEIIDTRMPVEDLRGTVYDLINYLLANGPVFKHGQTFGPTAEDKWRIEHTESRFRQGQGVIRLHVP